MFNYAKFNHIKFNSKIGVVPITPSLFTSTYDIGIVRRVVWLNKIVRKP